MKSLFVVLALLSVPECGVFSAGHSLSTDAGAQDGGPPFLTIEHTTCTPILVARDAGWAPLPWDGGELPLLDSGIARWQYEFPHCDLERLRNRTTDTPGVGLGIDAPTADLQVSATLMVGEWTGTRSTPWDAVHPLTIIFFDSGRYSIATGDCASPTYYGETCSEHLLSWRLDTGTSAQAEGEFVLAYEGSLATSIAWMKHVRVAAGTLSFDLWRGEYGPIHFELERVVAAPCAGWSLASCSPDAGSCQGLPEAQCRASGCTPVFGWRSADAGVSSLDLTSAYAGCHQPSSPGALDCQTAFSCGSPHEASECWLFSNTCQPTGWSTVDCAQSTLCPTFH
jgi:hypothetical protein